MPQQTVRFAGAARFGAAAAKKARVRQGAELRSARMKRAQLRISEKIEGQDRILNFHGSADILAMPAVQELLARYGREEIRLLLIDLSETEFINSPVWAVITLYARKRRNQSRVAIIGMSERIKASFEMMGLQKELLTFADVETAQRELL
jgi:anti-anti-sigma factor